MYIFPIVEDYDYKNQENINTGKQREVGVIVRSLKDCVADIIIFGSSIRPDCKFSSDTDIYVSMKPNVTKDEIYKRLDLRTKNGFDLITNEDNFDSKLRSEIIKGVNVYEDIT